MVITSPNNPRIKHVVKLRERRQRERDGLMLIEGCDEISLALANGIRLHTVFFCPPLSRPTPQAALLEKADQSGAELVEVSPSVFEKMAYRENPDGWLAVAPALRRRLADLTLSPNPLLVVAEAVEKPGNLGAILRSADAAGVDGVIICDPATDANNPNVVRASRGTLFTVQVAEAAGAEALAWLRERGIRIAAATPGAALSYGAADLRGPVAIAVGAEDEGLSRLWLENADLAVRIPMLGKVNSLNVATAAAVILFEAIRQRSVTSDE